MVDMSEIVEVRELYGAERVSRLIEQGSPWVLLSVAPGQTDDEHPCFLYCVGREYREPVEFLN